MQGRWIMTVALAALTLLIGVTGGAQVRAQDQRTVYFAGFESLRFDEGPFAALPGALAGQGWFAFTNPDAASVSTDLPRNGERSLRIEGAKLEGSLDGFFFGSYARAFIYEPIERGTPFVRASANINLSLSAEDGPTCGMGIGLSGALQGEFFPNVVIGVIENEGRFVSYISNADTQIVYGPEYTLGEWIHIDVIYNFRRGTAQGLVNSEPIGSVQFTQRMSKNIGALNIFLGADHAIPSAIGYVDDFKLELTRRG